VIFQAKTVIGIGAWTTSGRPDTGDVRCGQPTVDWLWTHVMPFSA